MVSSASDLEWHEECLQWRGKMIHTFEKVTAQVFKGQGDNKLAGSDD